MEHKGQIEKARNTYERLPDDQKALVTNIDYLQRAEAKILELEEEKKTYIVSFKLWSQFEEKWLTKPRIELKNTETGEIKNITETSCRLKSGTYTYKIFVPAYGGKMGTFGGLAGTLIDVDFPKVD